jgi:hypothetical protein
VSEYIGSRGTDIARAIVVVKSNVPAGALEYVRLELDRPAAAVVAEQARFRLEGALNLDPLQARPILTSLLDAFEQAGYRVCEQGIQDRAESTEFAVLLEN